MVWFSRMQSCGSYLEITALYSAFAPETPGTRPQTASPLRTDREEEPESLRPSHVQRTQETQAASRPPQASPNRGSAKDRGLPSNIPIQTRTGSMPIIAKRLCPESRE